MSKVGIITFHAAHNYGSNLQAYAMQKIIDSFGIENEIINFRTDRQKDQYRPFTNRKGLKYIIKNGYFFFNYSWRKKKYLKFEKFIDEKLKKTAKEYKSLDELYVANLDYEYYISGSDQIWNTVPVDADMAYFLPFVKKGIKIAYAPSFGQIGNIKNKKEIAEYLNEYKYLSIREKYGQKLIKSMINKCVPVLMDPTILIKKEEWENMISDRIIEDDYIFFYTLFATKEMINIVKIISKETGLKVVISNISNQYEIFSGFEKKLESGPMEFLNYIKYAKLVCSSSFHGTVFSILLNKPFYSINGMRDNRISTLLEMTNLTKRAITLNDVKNGLNDIFNLNFVYAEKSIEQEKQKAIKYLKEALDIEE